MDHYAALFPRGEASFLHPYAKNYAGILLAVEPILSVAAGQDPEVLGRAILSSLSASGAVVIEQEAKGDLEKPLRKAMSVRSQAQMMKGARFVSIDSQKDQVAFIPSKSRGSRGGFLELSKEAVFVPRSASVAEMGRAAFEALGRCV